jgi:hypothetical protein
MILMTKIVELPASTSFTVEQALHSALQSGIKEVLIIGFYDDGDLFIRSSKMDRRNALWMIKKAEKHCINEE